MRKFRDEQKGIVVILLILLIMAAAAVIFSFSLLSFPNKTQRENIMY